MVNQFRKAKKINPNEFTGLMLDHKELEGIMHVLFESKIFRYASRKKSVVDDFEADIRKYLNLRYALGLNNGTSALKAALVALGIKTSDRVLISSYTFIATPASVISVGGIPVAIDLDLKFGMDLVQLEEELKKGCSAIIVVHLQGRAFDILSILKLAKKYKVPVIEDACQAFSSKLNGKYAGTMADIGVYSFQQYKQLSSGEGGMLVTNNESYFKRAKTYSDHGIVREQMSWDVDGAMIGDNLRMNNLHAAILRSQLKKLPTVIRLQKMKRSYVMNRINGNQMSSILRSTDIEGETGMNIFFLVQSEEIATQIINHSKKRKIEFRRLWDRPYYKHGVFTTLKLIPENLGSKQCKNAEDISKRLISVSIPPVLTDQYLDLIASEINTLKKLKYLS